MKKKKQVGVLVHGATALRSFSISLEMDVAGRRKNQVTLLYSGNLNNLSNWLKKPMMILNLYMNVHLI